MSVGAVSSISSVNSSSAIQSTRPSAFKQRNQDFQALSQALGSNDLAGAQSAFAALQKDLAAIGQSRSGSQGGQTSQSSPSSIATALQALGQATPESAISPATFG